MALRVGSAGLVFLSTVLMARVLGAEGYGIYAYAYGLVALLAIPAHAGLPNLIVRETARGLADNRPDRVRGVWQWGAVAVAALSLVLVLALGPALVAWQGGLESPAGQTMVWALSLVPLIALGNLRGAALRGLQRVVEGQFPEFVIRPGLFLMLLAAAVFAVGTDLSPSGAMALYAAASLLAFGAGVWLLRKRTPPAVAEAPVSVEGRIWLVSSVTFAFVAGFNVVINQASSVALGLFESAEAVGRFRVAMQVATLASLGLQAVNLVVAPRFAELWHRGERPGLQRLVTRSAQLVLALSLLAAAAVAVAGRPVLEMLFGADFGAAYRPLMILLAGQVANSTAGSVGMLLNMTGHEQDVAAGMVVGVAVNVSLNLALVPPWGIEGAACATAASTVIWNAVLYWRVRRRLGIRSLAF